MWRWLQRQWEHIRGNAKWWLVTKVGEPRWGYMVAGGALLTATAVTVWGWIASLPGPILFELFLGGIALSLLIANGIGEWRLRRRWLRGQTCLPPGVRRLPEAQSPPVHVGMMDVNFQNLSTGGYIQFIEFPVDLNLREGESFITLRQHIAPPLAKQIDEALTQPDYSVEFYFNTLTLNVLSAGTLPTRLALWNGIACRPGMTIGRIHEMYSQSSVHVQ
jgi:hypothetical protein